MHPIAVNLSLASIQDVDFRNWLKQLMTKNKQLHQQLVFSVSTFSIVKDIKTYESFVSFIHDHNGSVMLKRFETHSISIERVKDLKPDYIRLSRDLSNDVHSDSGKQQFIQSMQELGHLLGVVVLAESVRDKRDINYFKKVGFAGLSLSDLGT
jgi:EAL domain-containing protein (putative c-di-GMP-specific phosphodiesterase class I)